jgi:hypothetical protein
MSDRTQSSVRTGSRSGDADAATESAPAGKPVTSTQSIPGAGTSRTQGAAGGATPADAPGLSAPVPPIPPTVTAPAPAPAVAVPAPAPAVAVPAPAPAVAVPAPAPAVAVPAPAATVGPEGKGPARGRGPAKAGGRGPRRARLQLRHIDIWSAFKISLVLSVALFFIWMVAVGVLYGVLGSLGVFDTLNELFGQLGTASGSEAGGDVVTPGVVFGGAAVIGAINVVLMTALCTVGTFIYNLCSDLVGGLELTLSERD